MLLCLCSVGCLNLEKQQKKFNRAIFIHIMRKVWYHQIWIQNYLGFIVSDLVFSSGRIGPLPFFGHAQKSEFAFHKALLKSRFIFHILILFGFWNNLTIFNLQNVKCGNIKIWPHCAICIDIKTTLNKPVLEVEQV